MKNNLFSFATSELSQDAFICWCLNWFNDKTNQKLHEMAISLIKRMTGDIEIESVEIIRQYSDVAEYIDENGNKKKQAVKIDVLAIINKSIGLIIEDKTFSSVHDDQIMRYGDGLKIILSKSDNNQLFYKGKTYLLDPELIKTVFWKTGFNYDYDQAIKADVKFDGETIKGFLSGYRGINEILDDYLDNLENNLRWYKENGDFTIPFETDSGEKRYDWYCNLSQNQYPQYCLMRTFFPSDRWKLVYNSEYELYQIYHAASRGGRPWTQTIVYENKYPGTEDAYWLFWRIDTDSKGPYLSLRLYEDKETYICERHKELYERLVAAIKGVIEEGHYSLQLCWRDVYPGFRGNYKESSIFHIQLKNYLSEWSKYKDIFPQTIREINDVFLLKINELSVDN